MDPLVEYYSQRAPEYEEIYHRHDPARQMELVEIAELVRRTFKKRRVLEIACGTGFWTKLLVEAAEIVVATDASPRMIEVARQKLGSNGCVMFQQADAYNLAAVPGTFDAALANFWLSHVPRARLQCFLEQFHARLGRGAVVFMADNMNVSGVGGELVCPVGSEDTYKRRQLKDGSTHNVIKNYYNADQLRQMLSAHCSDCDVHCGSAYWWVRYCVR